MSEPVSRRFVVVAAACLVVMLLAALVVLAPASAQEPSTVSSWSGPVIASSSGSIVTSPISRSLPISRGHIIVPIPLWCNWPTPMPMPVPPGKPTPIPPTPVPSPTPGGMASSAPYSVCARTAKKVPLAVQQEALAEPWKIYGYNKRLNPNTPYHPMWNPLRTQLGLMNPNVAYHPCNPVVWKANCP